MRQQTRTSQRRDEHARAVVPDARRGPARPGASLRLGAMWTACWLVAEEFQAGPQRDWDSAGVSAEDVLSLTNRGAGDDEAPPLVCMVTGTVQWYYRKPPLGLMGQSLCGRIQRPTVTDVAAEPADTDATAQGLPKPPPSPRRKRP